MKVLTLSIMILSVVLANSAGAADPKFLNGFDKCRKNWDSLEKALDKVPYTQHEGYRAYRYETTYKDIPINEIWWGTCNDGSHDGCGFSGYLSLVVNTSWKEAQETLKAKTGIDYRDELKDPEFGVHQRMYLTKHGKNVFLECDVGDL